MKKRRQNVTLRAKVRAKRNRRTVSLVFLGLLLAGLFYQAPKAWATVSMVDAPRWTRWYFQALKVHCADTETAAAISSAIRFPQGVEVSLKDCAIIEQSLKAALPSVSSVKAERNWFTKQLEITAVMRVAVAQTADGRKIDEDGYIYSDGTAVSSAAVSASDMLTVTSAAELNGRLDGRAVTLVKAVAECSDLFPSRPAEVYLGVGADDAVALADGTRIKWGGDGFVKEKAMRVAQVYSKTSAKLPAPYNIDLSYFEDGKILLSQPAASAVAQNAIAGRI